MNVLKDVIVESIRRSTLQVFSTMLDAELRGGEYSFETAAPDTNDGVVSFIGVAGAWAGTGSISCSPSMACRIYSQMLMTESNAVDEDVLDAVAEITNMVIGNVKTDLEEKVGPLGLSIPTVVFGHNFRAKSAGAAGWIVVRFEWESEPLVVKVCLAPAEKAPHPLGHAVASVCPLDV
jgi:chemotaxis protein CheX